MEDTFICKKAAWRRENATHHYAGSVAGSGGALRLAGRDPATGIQVTLVIPAEEIDEVRVSTTWSERVVGERCVVLELADSTPILLREIGSGAADPEAIAARLAAAVHAPAPVLASGSRAVG